MKFRKYISTALTLAVVLGSLFIKNNDSYIYADDSSLKEISTNLSEGNTITESNGNVIIENDNSKVVLSLDEIISQNKNGKIKKVNLSQYARISFQVELGETITKNYNATLYVKYKGSLQKAATSKVSIGVKCTGAKKIKASSSISNIKSYNGFSVNTSKKDGPTGSTSTTSATLRGSKLGVSESQTFRSKNVVTSDAGSSQGYMVVVNQSWV